MEVEHEVQEICKTKLDNADLEDISFDVSQDMITLKFIVAGTFEIIDFMCSGIMSVVMTKDPGDDCYFIGGAKVTSVEFREAVKGTGWHFEDHKFPECVYCVDIHGSIELEIRCTKFSWKHCGVLEEQ